MPCMSGAHAVERAAAWAAHRKDLASGSTRRELRSRRLESLREQLSAPKRSPQSAKQALGGLSSSPTAADVTADSVFEPAQEHFKIPHGLWLREATSVGVDSEDRVYVFNRGNMPIMVFDIDGNLVDRWGNETPFDGDAPFPGARNSRWHGTEFIAPHAITIDHEDNLWLVDDSAHTITKCDRHGNRLMMLLPEGAIVGSGGGSAYGGGGADPPGSEAQGTLGEATGPVETVVLTKPEEMAEHIGQPHKPPPRHSGRMFNLPTDIAVVSPALPFPQPGGSSAFRAALCFLSRGSSPFCAQHPETGDLFICDGYGNSHVHHLRGDGTHVKSWGEPGVLDGQL